MSIIILLASSFSTFFINWASLFSTLFTKRRVRNRDQTRKYLKKEKIQWNFKKCLKTPIKNKTACFKSGCLSFDFGTDYKASLRHNHKLVQECKEILQDARHTEEFKGHYHEVLVRIESREREIALESVREKYIEINR